MEHIGIDVSKNKLDVLWLRDPQSRKVKTKIFPNNTKGFSELSDWACKQTQSETDNICFTMEATGIYHEPLAEYLFEKGFPVVVANPHKIHHHGKGLGVKTKTDKKDSFIIAHYSFANSPTLWQPENQEIKRLRALIARLDAIEKDLQREENRLEKTQVNTDVKAVFDSLNGTIQHLKTEKKRFEQLIDNHIDQNPNLKRDKTLLETIPGVGRVIATRMIATLRSRTFNKATQAAAYCGLVPIEKTSGESIRGKPCLSKSGSGKFRAKLYMATISATQCNPMIKAHYNQLISRGKTKMSALGAAMRKMVHICFGVLKHQKAFNGQLQDTALLVK